MWLFQLAAWIGVSASLLRFALEAPFMSPFLLWVALGLAYFSLSFLANTSFVRFDLLSHEAAAVRVRRRGTSAPSVDVFIPNCGEPLPVLTNTFRHVAALDYSGPLRVWCLDDRGRPEVAVLANEYGFEYLSRPNKGEFKKAGNLRYAYERTGGDFIVVFDADFCPRPDFLVELLSYALDDPEVGIVQSPQYFDVAAAQNWLQRGAGAVQEYFYRWVMPARDQRHSPICVGTNAIYRRAALDTTGGGALVENSEDVHTGFDLLAEGWRTKYVPVVLAAGLCPDTFAAYFNQQYRWCAGSMSLLFSRKFWHAKIGIRARLSYLAGMSYYLYTGLAILVMPLPAVMMAWLYPDRVALWNYVPLVPAAVQTFVVFPRWHRCRYDTAAFRVKGLYVWSHLFAFADRIRGRAVSWQPTGGSTHTLSGQSRLARRLAIAWPTTIGTLAIIGALRDMTSPLDTTFWPIIISGALFVALGIGIGTSPAPAVRDTPEPATRRIAPHEYAAFDRTRPIAIASTQTSVEREMSLETDAPS